jgi:eukaryotic-like serine/threonine-protein kinase
VLVTLSPARIGRYEIVGVVGEGGMGRVYRARDSQLARTVAIKMLPPSFAADADCLRRFEQESRATALLSHPGVLSVFDVGVHDGVPYQVSELLEGSTLRERLDAERLSVRQAVEFGTQIAEALAAAHGKGIVHRDLKPENLFVTSSDRIKILDFGLARLTAAAGSEARADATGTLDNAILGTPGYMAPEQARGQKADHRADIFSFGCVLYEMLQGRRAFQGDSVADRLSAVLKEAPSPLASSIERPVAPALDGIVQRCLAKDPGSRFQSASDLAFALRNVTFMSDVRPIEPEASPPSLTRSRRRLAWTGIALVAAIALATLVAFQARQARTPQTAIGSTEFLVPPPTTEQSFAPLPLPGLLPTAPQVGLSPDGRQLAFVTTDPTGKRQLWIRSLENSSPRLIDGTEGVSSWPFWSADSRHVVIAAARALMNIDTIANTVERLATMPEETPSVPFVTGSWGDDGTILFSIGGRTGLYQTSAAGSPPRQVTTIDQERGDQYHSWPQLVSGGRFLVFVRTDNAETNGLYAGRLGSNTLQKVLANASRAVYADGHLLWTIEDRLVARPFDATTLTFSGEPVTIAPSVFVGAGRTPGFWVSNAGSVVYAVGDTRERQFRWFSRGGTALESIGPPGLYVTFDASADLSKIVVEVSRDAAARYSTLAMFETARGVLTPLTIGNQNDSDPRFGAHGEVVFARNSREDPGIVRIDPASGRRETLLPRGSLPVIWLEDWASDGSSMIYRTGANRDAWQLLGSATEPRKLTDAREPIEQVQLSPDKKWIAYNTAESGQSEVYVSSVPFGGERRQVSVAGGVQPTWRGDGRELFYLGLDGALYTVDISADGGTLRTGTPNLLFRTSLPVISAVVEQYRPSADGQRFLLCVPLTFVQHEPLRMLLNWELRR